MNLSLLIFLGNGKLDLVPQKVVWANTRQRH